MYGRVCAQPYVRTCLCAEWPYVNTLGTAAYVLSPLCAEPLRGRLCVEPLMCRVSLYAGPPMCERLCDGPLIYLDRLCGEPLTYCEPHLYRAVYVLGHFGPLFIGSTMCGATTCRRSHRVLSAGITKRLCLVLALTSLRRPMIGFGASTAHQHRPLTVA
jgi:hypothetical protein